MTNKEYIDVNGIKLEPEIDEKGTGYYIRENGRRTFYQYPPYIPYQRETVLESAIVHIEKELEDRKKAKEEQKRREEEEKNRPTIENLMREVKDLKTLNSAQDDMIFEQSYEIAMLKLNTASAAV